MDGQFAFYSTIILLFLDIFIIALGFRFLRRASNVTQYGIVILFPFFILILIPYFFLDEPQEFSQIAEFPHTLRLGYAGILAIGNSVVLYFLKERSQLR